MTELTSIEPAELKGCACDGYAQLEVYLAARLGEVELVAVCHGVASGAEPARGRTLPIVEGVESWHDVERACERVHARPDRVLAIGATAPDAEVLGRAWVAVALRDAAPEAVSAASALTRWTASQGGLARLLDEVESLRRDSSSE